MTGEGTSGEKPAPYSKRTTDRIELGARRGPTPKYRPLGDNPKFDIDREGGRVRYHSNRRPVTDPAILAALVPPPAELVVLDCCGIVALNDGGEHGFNGLTHRMRHMDRLTRERPLGYRRPRKVPKHDSKASGWSDTVGRDRAMRRHTLDTEDQFAVAREEIPLLGQNDSREEFQVRWGIRLLKTRNYEGNHAVQQSLTRNLRAA